MRERSIESGRILELADGEEQEERDRILGEGMKDLSGNVRGMRGKGFPFVWADAQFQQVLWRYNIKAEAENIWTRVMADGKVLTGV